MTGLSEAMQRPEWFIARDKKVHSSQSQRRGTILRGAIVWTTSQEGCPEATVRGQLAKPRR